MKRSILFVVASCVAILTSGCQAAASPTTQAPSASSASAPTGPSTTQGTAPSNAPTTPGPSGNDAPAHWVAAGGSGTASLDHAVQLGDGRVVVLTDSVDTPAATAQTWDPATNAWQPAEGLNKFRTQYVAVQLAGGRALVTGGENQDAVSFSSTYLFDPSTETWSKSGLLATARTSPIGATLKDGRVLVAGGYFNNGGPTGGIEPDAVLAAFGPGDLRDIDIPPFAVAMATAELFDPVTGTWSPTGPMRYARYGSPAVTLADGRVLVFGSAGVLGDGIQLDGRTHENAEIYDPATGKFSPAGTLPPYDAAAIEAQGAHNANPVPSGPGEIIPGTLVALPDGGAVLIGVDYYWKHEGDLSRSFRYDAAHNTWSEIGETWALVGEPTPVALVTEGVPNLLGSAAATLPNGRVLVAGGSGPTPNGFYPGSDGTDAARYYDPATNTWPDAPAMPAPAFEISAISLADGSVFVFGASVYRQDQNVSVTPSRFIP
jgi:hypothetical protein